MLVGGLGPEGPLRDYLRETKAGQLQIMPSTLFIGDPNLLLFIPPVIYWMLNRNIQHLKVLTKRKKKKTPDLLDCSLFAGSIVSSASAHLLIYWSVFMGIVLVCLAAVTKNTIYQLAY